jgi:hypothetical protein
MTSDAERLKALLDSVNEQPHGDRKREQDPDAFVLVQRPVSVLPGPVVQIIGFFGLAALACKQVELAIALVGIAAVVHWLRVKNDKLTRRITLKTSV